MKQTPTPPHLTYATGARLASGAGRKPMPPEVPVQRFN
jgi:hypothetical protein